MQKPNLQKLENQVNQWNVSHPVGTPVMRYKLINPRREGTLTKTRSEAWVMGGHSAMVMVEGVSGGVLLESLLPNPSSAKPIDLEYLGEHEHLKMEDAQSMHSMMMRHHGITDPDEIVADWNRRDPQAPWGSGKIGKYVRELTTLCFDFMAAKIKEAGGPDVEVNLG